MRYLILLVALAMPLPALAEDGGTLEGEAVVLDGDALDVAYVRVRLLGVVAPEAEQACAAENDSRYFPGISARNRLKRLIAGRPVTCRTVDRDREGYTLAVCETADGLDLGREMVALGWAWAQGPEPKQYDKEESGAKIAKIGIWSGTCEAPRALRK